MRDAVRDWISIHTTPRTVVGLLLLVGCGLVVAAVCILVLYPDFTDRNPVYYILAVGVFMVAYGKHKQGVNALLRELGHIVDKSGRACSARASDPPPAEASEDG